MQSILLWHSNFIILGVQISWITEVRISDFTGVTQQRLTLSTNTYHNQAGTYTHLHQIPSYYNSPIRGGAVDLILVNSCP